MKGCLLGREWVLVRGRIVLGCAVLALLAAGGLTTAAAGPSVPLVRVHIEAYVGRHHEQARFRAAFAGLESRVDACLAFVQEALGPTLPADGVERASIHVHVLDADLERWGRDRARCRTARGADGEHQHIDLFAEYFISGDSDLTTVLRHELVHAVMRARMGSRAYEALPHWVREGLAVHVAQEGRHHLRRTLLAHEDVDALMTGLMGKRRSLVMYPYAWLAVDYLREKAGAEAVLRFARGVMDGRHPRKLAAKITDSTWKSFLAGVRRYAHTRIEFEAQGLEDIKDARALYRKRAYDRARAAFDAFLERYPESAFAPTARYYRARSLYRQRRYDEAGAGFAACIKTDLGCSGWIDECHLFLGIALYETERDEDAVTMLRDYVSLHPYSDQHDLGYLALGRALGRLGRDEMARSAFEAVGGARRARGAQRAAAARELAALGDPAVSAAR